MKILQLFGLGNTATLLTAGLRQLGVDCDILLSNRHFITQYPKWTSNYPELDGHVYMWDKSDMRDPMTVVDLFKFCRRYDLVSCHPPAAVYAWMFGRPYTMWDGGSANFVMDKKYQSPSYQERLTHESARRGYKDADYVFCNDINVIYQVMKKMSWMHDRYGAMPLPVDTDVFTPDKEIYDKRKSEDERFIAYLPTRQAYIIKGIDSILRGFKQFVEDCCPDALLRITYYGADAKFTAVMCRYLGILENVEFIRLVPKPEFRNLINMSDVVIDQVALGAIGGVTVQSMACEKPVIVNANQRWYNEQYGEGIPVVNARDVEGVYQGLRDVHNGKYGDLGKPARDYVRRNHHYTKIARGVLKVYESIL
jgi:hypothetical protein